MSENCKNKFGFPFEPYNIQVEFMKNLYQVLDDGKIGIFESPTGTGKSLSLICGTLTWLKDFEKKTLEDIEAQLESKNKNTDSNFDWFDQFSKQKEEEWNKKEIKEKYEKYKKREERIKRIKEQKRDVKQHEIDVEFDELFKDAEEIRSALKTALKTAENVDEELLLDYSSDDENKKVEEEEEEGEDDNDLITRIYYCSRTHSQLVQFVREIQKSPFSKDVRVVSLASRQTTCINESVTRLKSLSLINDQCLNLQKNKKGKSTLCGCDDKKIIKKKKVTQGCPFYKANSIDLIQKDILTQVVDIEQVVEIGKKKHGCPFYASRRAAPDAQLIILPYNTLLHKNTREASGVKLKNSVIIIDEAHNLTDAITNIHSVEINGSQLLKAHSQLLQYQQKYKFRLKAKNMLYINQLLFILVGLIKQIGGEAGVSGLSKTSIKSCTNIFMLNDFLTHAKLDNINLFKIIDFCEGSEIAKKIIGFIEKYQITDEKHKEIKEDEKQPSSSVSQFLQRICDPKKSIVIDKPSKNIQIEQPKEFIVPNSPLNQIISFFEAITNANKDGRVVISIKDTVSESTLKYMLLNPSTHFKEIVSSAKSIIVAGGTMQPISEFIDQLFLPAGAKNEKIVNFSYGHVIPNDHLLAMVMAKGPSGMELNFSYENRQTSNLIDELGRLICNISNIIPGGIVCFFPSYDYANTVCEQWNKLKTLDRIAVKKKIFKEPKTSALCQQVLAEYSKTIQKCKEDKTEKLTGAILFSVVGGKMSEGINFSDDLGRCVIMVGMPYPNIKSVELKEKMDYMNKTLPKSKDGHTAGQIYYENVCMKAVNQSIGRAIRHINDYAVILLIDSRYSKLHIQKNLPSWIANRLKNADTFGNAFSNIRKFFNDKKK